MNDSFIVQKLLDNSKVLADQNKSLIERMKSQRDKTLTENDERQKKIVVIFENFYGKPIEDLKERIIKHYEDEITKTNTF